MKQLVRCITCNALFVKTPFDQWPEYESLQNQSRGSVQEIEKDDFQEFLKAHRGHRIEPLEILTDSFVSDRPYHEPLRVSYFKATNGKDQFVVKRFRERIDEPFSYQLISGDYSLKLLRIDIQEEEIRRQLEWELESSLISQDQRDAFVDLYRHIVRSIKIDNLERVPEESNHPLEVYYRIDEVSLFYLLRNCRTLFKGKSYQAIESFIDRHKEDGVLLLKGTYQILFKEKPRLQAETLPPVEDITEEIGGLEKRIKK